MSVVMTSDASQNGCLATVGIGREAPAGSGSSQHVQTLPLDVVFPWTPFPLHFLPHRAVAVAE